MRGWLVASLQATILGACSFDLEIEPTDAAPPAVDAPLVCDPAFTVVLAGSGSKYQLIGNEITWRNAEATCEQRGAHLFVPTTNAEVTAMRALLDDTRRWVGLAQMPGATPANAGWLLVTGGPRTVDWVAGKPDDNGGGENGDEQAGSMNDLGLDDDDHRDTKPYICECDGAGVDASIVAMLPP